MRVLFTAILVTLCTIVLAQPDTGKHRMFTNGVYQRHSTQVSLSLGFFDGYRNDLAFPAGFEKNNTSGYTNISVKVDYGISKNFSLAASFGYDAFVYNFNQLYTGHNGTIKRYKTNTFRMFNIGVIGYYHLGMLIKVNRLDPFVGIGLSLNNIRYSAYPQGDSTIVKLDHTVTPYIKAGARYYMSDRFSIFGDVGYEKQAILSIGFSCRFLPKKDTPKGVAPRSK
jgi:hypothetical protein